MTVDEYVIWKLRGDKNRRTGENARSTSGRIRIEKLGPKKR